MPSLATMTMTLSAEAIQREMLSELSARGFHAVQGSVFRAVVDVFAIALERSLGEPITYQATPGQAHPPEPELERLTWQERLLEGIGL